MLRSAHPDEPQQGMVRYRKGYSRHRLVRYEGPHGPVEVVHGKTSIDVTGPKVPTVHFDATRKQVLASVPPWSFSGTIAESAARRVPEKRLPSQGSFRIDSGGGLGAISARDRGEIQTTFLFQNHLGSTVAAFDDTSNSRIAQYYYPYGAERAAVGTLPVDQRYTGQTSDATGADSGDTGLVYYNARYYDPAVGAFVAADTIVPTVGISVGLNRYAYVAGNPTNLTDPDGEGWIQTAAYIIGTSADRRPDVTYEVGHNPETIAAVNQAINEGRVIQTELGYTILPPAAPEEPDYGDYDLAGLWRDIVENRDLLFAVATVIACIGATGGACLAYVTAANTIGASIDLGLGADPDDVLSGWAIGELFALLGYSLAKAPVGTSVDDLAGAATRSETPLELIGLGLVPDLSGPGSAAALRLWVVIASLTVSVAGP